MNRRGINLTVGELKEMLRLFRDETEICFEHSGVKQLNFSRLKPDDGSRLRIILLPQATEADAGS